MRLKYYLRGLGIGIAVTAVIMGVSAGQENSYMTDDQVIARAKELGMVEQEGVLAEIAEQPPETEKPESNTETKKPQAEKPESNAAAEKPQAERPESSAATKKPQAERPEGSAAAEKPQAEKPESGETPGQQETQIPAEQNKVQTSSVVVTVYPGEGSYTVSRKLAALGLVESADIYDKYLCQNGYDKKLCTGNYTITQGATAEEIAKILTKRQ